MSDGDSLVIGATNVGEHTTELGLYVDTKASTVFKVQDVTDATCILAVSLKTPTIGGAGTGVRGESFFGQGVHGKSSSGTGVKGESETGAGVRGTSTKNGVHGDSDSGTGVLGSSTSGPGVRGESESDYGVKGTSTKSHGVFGESTNGIGVVGHAVGANSVSVNGYSQAGIGVRGDSFTGPGVYGTSANKEGVSGFSSVGTGVYGQTADPSGYAGRFDGRVLVKGAFTVVGSKNAAVQLPDGSHRLMYCQESPEPWLEDFGEAKLVGGRADVRIEQDFVKTLDMARPYHVFVTPHDLGPGTLAVTDRSADRFVVQAANAANGSFSYRIVGRRKDIAGERLARIEVPAQTTTPKFLAGQHPPAHAE